MSLRRFRSVCFIDPAFHRAGSFATRRGEPEPKNSDPPLADLPYRPTTPMVPRGTG